MFRLRLLSVSVLVAGLLATVALGASLLPVATTVSTCVAVDSQMATPTPSALVSVCTGSVTSTLSATTVRVCDPVTVTAAITPVCAGCGGGINVVYLNPLHASYGRWMQAENASALDVLEGWQQLGVRVKAAVFEIQYGTVIPKVELTSHLSSVRAVLHGFDLPNGGYSCYGWDQAVNRAVPELERDRRESGLTPCEIFITHACIIPDEGWTHQLSMTMLRQA